VESVSSPELLVIQAVSPRPRKPQHEVYVVHARVHSGEWTNGIRLKGTSEVRDFLKNNRVDVKEIDSLLEQLVITRNIMVSNAHDETLLTRALNSLNRGQRRSARLMWT
jgi:hypothetical protein